jgi:hypothetical protein
MCGAMFTPHPQGAHRAKYCSARCRRRMLTQKRAAQEAEADREQAAAIDALSRSEGYTTPDWSNGRGTT